MAAAISHRFHNSWKDQTGFDTYSTHLRPEDFQRVKLQLRALGLITKNPAGDARWVLTPYGDSVLTKVAAIPCKNSPAIPESRRVTEASTPPQ